MTGKELVQALRRLRGETGSLACFGCGREHNCGTHGCAILREAADMIELLTAENAKAEAERDALREKNWGCRQQMSEKLYGAYLTSVQNVREAKLELAKQAAQCVERVMLDDDMFLVKGDTVGWKVRIYRNESDNYVEELP